MLLNSSRRYWFCAKTKVRVESVNSSRMLSPSRLAVSSPSVLPRIHSPSDFTTLRVFGS